MRLVVTSHQDFKLEIVEFKNKDCMYKLSLLNVFFIFIKVSIIKGKKKFK